MRDEKKECLDSERDEGVFGWFEVSLEMIVWRGETINDNQALNMQAKVTCMLIFIFDVLRDTNRTTNWILQLIPQLSLVTYSRLIRHKRIYMWMGVLERCGSMYRSRWEKWRRVLSWYRQGWHGSMCRSRGPYCSSLAFCIWLGLTTTWCPCTIMRVAHMLCGSLSLGEHHGSGLSPSVLIGRERERSRQEWLCSANVQFGHFLLDYCIQLLDVDKCREPCHWSKMSCQGFKLLHYACINMLSGRIRGWWQWQ